MSSKPHHTPAKKLEIVTISYQLGLRQTEKLYNVTKKTIQSWRKQYQDEGLAGLAKNNRLINRVRKISEAQKRAILELCAAQPQLSNRKIVASLQLNCSAQTVLKIRRELSAQDRNEHHFNRWFFSSSKLSCTVNQKAVYLLSATERHSGVTLIGTAEENIPLYLNAFVESVLNFLKAIGRDSQLTISANSSRFSSPERLVECLQSKAKAEKNLPDLIKKKLNAISADFRQHQDLLRLLDEMLLAVNVELLQQNLHTGDWSLLKFQPAVISFDTANSVYSQKSVSQITAALVKMIESEILKFDLSKANNLLNYLIKIASTQPKNPELQIKIQLLWGDKQLHSYNYSKTLYHYTKALKAAELSASDRLKFDAELALSGFFLITSQYRKCEKSLNNALRLSRDLKLSKVEGDILGHLGSLYKITNDPRASTVADYLLEMAINADDKELYCQYFNLISTIHFAAGFYEKGFSCAQKSLTLAQKYNYPQAVFEANYNIAEYGLRVDKFALAEEHLLANQKESFKPDNYSSDDVKNLIRLGLIKCRLNDLKAGLDILEKSLYLAKKRDDRFSESLALNHLGQVFLHKLDFKKAAFYFNKAAKINELIGNKEQQLVIYGCLSTCYSEMKQGKKALMYAHKKLDEVKNTKNRIQIASAYGSIGSAAVANQEFDTALKYYQLQFKVLKPTDADLHKVLALGNIGTIHLRNQNYQLAQSCFKKAEKKLIPLEGNQYLGLIYLDLAKIAKATGKVKKLKEYLRLAKEKAEIAGDMGIVRMAEEVISPDESTKSWK